MALSTMARTIMNQHSAHPPVKDIAIRMDLPCILIDASYYVFFRYFTTLKAYRTEHPHSLYKTHELHESRGFIQSIYHDMDTDIHAMLSHWRTTPSNVLFCRDCPRRSIWRNEHISDYKGKRAHKSTFNPNMFDSHRSYCLQRQLNMIEFPRMEADDIVALTKDKLRSAGFEKDIIIITNDNDYLQLLDARTHAYNMNERNNNLRLRGTGDPSVDLRMKIIMGDKSDNIPPIRSHIGAKKAQKLASLPSQDLQDYLVQNNCAAAFERNQRLIDFSFICPSLKDSFMKTLMIKSS